MTILRERCDGNRNLLHACVSMCAPVSNKDHEAGKFDFCLVEFPRTFFDENGSASAINAHQIFVTS